MKKLLFILTLFSISFFCTACGGDNFWATPDAAYEDLYYYSSGDYSFSLGAAYAAAQKPVVGGDDLFFNSENYIKTIIESPQSPEIVTYVPGMYTFRGLVVAGGNIELSGYTRIMGGAYSLGKLKLDQGAVLVEDSGCLENVAAVFKDRVNIFNEEAKKPIKLDSIARRPRVIHYSETSEYDTEPGVPALVNRLKTYD